MYIANLRVTYETASHEVLSHMTLNDEYKDHLYQALLAPENINEVVILQTCNRFEVFYSGKGEEKGTAQARKIMLNTFGALVAKYLVADQWVDTIAHLLRLVSSVDSLIVGEHQILAQVKEAFNHSSENEYCGRVLRPTFQKALSVGKRVRTETRISNGKVSVSSAAVDKVNERSSLEGKKVMVLGSGKMASLLAEYLCTFKTRDFVVVGRTPERLETFCCQYPSRGVTFASLEEELSDADVLFSATSCPHVLVTRDIVERVMRDRDTELTVVDIAMPEDVDPTIARAPNVEFHCLDDLMEVSERNKQIRQAEAIKAEAIITEEIEQFMESLQYFHIQSLLSHLNLYTEEIRRRELGKAVSMLETVDQKTEMVMDSLTKSLMKKFMHNFMSALKEYPGDSEEIKSFVHIFIGSHLQPGEGDGQPVRPRHPHGVDKGVKDAVVERDVPRSTDEKT